MQPPRLATSDISAVRRRLAETADFRATNSARSRSSRRWRTAGWSSHPA